MRFDMSLHATCAPLPAAGSPRPAAHVIRRDEAPFEHRFDALHSPTPGQRPLRVGEAVRHALVEVFARGHIRDPDLADVRSPSARSA